MNKILFTCTAFLLVSNFRQSNARPSIDIIGACNATLGEFPWEGYVEFYRNNRSSAYCALTLISTNYAITEAGCIYLYETSENTTGHVVKFGTVNLNDTTIPNYYILNVIYHPNYSFTKILIANNIAVIRFNSSIKLDNNVKPIMLPLDDSELIGRSNSIVGWGDYNINCGGNYINDTVIKHYSQVLLKASVSVLDYVSCKNVLPGYQNADVNITNKTLCAGSTPIGTTYGDAGTPLHTVDDKGSWYLTGIMSFFIIHGTNHSIMLPPRIYTRVSAYCDFVKNATNGEVSCTEANQPTSSTKGTQTNEYSIILFLTNFVLIKLFI